MNRIERLTAILLLLQDKSRTSEEIARHFEVSRRTVLRDVQALSEMGVPVIAREGAGGGYSLPADYQLAPLALTTSEAFLLLLALDGIRRLADTPFGAARATLSAKLQALLPQQALSSVEPLLHTVMIDVPARSQRAPFLDALVEAAQQGRWLSVTYVSAEHASAQHILPLQLSASNGFWYCRAYAHEHDAERLYRVDRIRTLAPVDGAFAPPERASRPYDDPSHPQVVVNLSARGVAAVESEPHLGSQIERRADGSGRLAFRCPPRELDWYARYFGGMGTEAHVLAPAELRERLHELGEKLLELYAQW